MQSIGHDDTLTIKLSGAPATSNPSFWGSYMDAADSAITADAAIQPTALNGATAVPVFASPAAGTVRHLVAFTMTNTDTAAITVSIALNGVVGIKLAMDVGDVLQFGKNTDAWTVTRSTGAVKQDAATATWGNVVGTLAAQTDLQSALDGKVDENVAIVGATKTKIAYDAKGLVTAGADATTADIADSADRRYCTDAQKAVIANTSGTNTGDQTLTGLGGVPTSRTVAGHALASDVTLAKGDVGLGNVDNTSDANKLISTATQTALDGKIATTARGAANGVASLDTDGLHKASEYRVATASATGAQSGPDKAKQDTQAPGGWLDSVALIAPLYVPGITVVRPFDLAATVAGSTDWNDGGLDGQSLTSKAGVANIPGWQLVANMATSKWLLAFRFVAPVPVAGKNCFIGLGNAWTHQFLLGAIYNSGANFATHLGLRLVNATGTQDVVTDFVSDGNEHEGIICNTGSAADVYIDRVLVLHHTDRSHVSPLAGRLHMYESNADFHMPVRGLLAFGSVL